MYRLLLVAVGLVELLFPRLVLRLYTAITYRGSADVEPRAWVVTLARVEGLFLLAVGLRGFRTASETDGETTG